MKLPQEYADSEIEVSDWKNRKIGCSIESEGKEIRLLFEAEVPPSVIPRIISRKSQVKERFQRQRWMKRNT